jgi:copper transport protein
MRYPVRLPFTAGARSVAFVVFGSLVMLLAARSVAHAHASLVSSEPAANAHLSVSPARVRLVFSEETEPTLARLSLVADDGSVTQLVVSGDPHDVHAIVAPVASLASGSYRLVWRVVSADGHPVEGSILFWIGNSAAQPPPVSPAALNTPSTWGPTVVGAPIVPAVLRGLGLGSLMALAGLLFCLSLPRSANDPAQRRPAQIATCLSIAAAMLLALHLGAWIMNATPDHRLGSDSTSALLASRIGTVELWRTGLAILALWALTIARRQRVALLFAVAALMVSGATGHSAAIDPIWTAPARALHLLAGGAWLGALIYLIAYDRDAIDTFLRDALRVSTIALVAAIVVVLSGVLQALLFLSSPRDLFTSPYGAVLLAKIAGFLILIAFGAHHRYRVLPRLAHDATFAGSFAATIRSEVAVMAIVVLLGGFLAYVSPPHHAAVHTSHVHTVDQ